MVWYTLNYEGRFIEDPKGEWGKRSDILKNLNASGFVKLYNSLKPKVRCPKCKSTSVHGEINGSYRFCADCEHEWDALKGRPL